MSRLLALIALGAFVAQACAQTPRLGLEPDEETPSLGAVVGFSWVDWPLERIGFISAADRYCQLRFLRYWVDSSGGRAEKKFAELELAEGRLNGGGVIEFEAPKTILLSDRGYAGLGFHWSWRRGDFTLRCGARPLEWKYPTRVSFYELADVRLLISGNKGFGKTYRASELVFNIGYDASQSREREFLPIDALPTFLQ